MGQAYFCCEFGRESCWMTSVMMVERKEQRRNSF